MVGTTPPPVRVATGFSLSDPLRTIGGVNAMHDLDRIWQRGFPGQVLLLISASSLVLSSAVTLWGLAALLGP